MNAPSIIGKDLSVGKGKTTILQGLDFEIKKGSLTGLIGPSGSGKTTLMRTIIGLQAATIGELNINGLKAGHKSLRRHIGYVSQTPSIYEDLTVAQNLEYFAVLIGAPKSAIAKVLKQVDLADQSKQLAITLSGGQKARVSLAIALLGNPDILVLDEPTVGLDPVLRRDLWQTFTGLAEAGHTILVSSHVMTEADKCDDVLLMRDGQLLWAGQRSGLLAKAKADSVEAAFLKLVETA